ncbi:MAG: acyltransferase [Acidobacteriota bacterium]
MIFIHPTALVASPRIGEGTRIWAFVNVLEGATIGRDCNICDGCFVENDVVVGDRVTVKSGVSLWDGVRLEDGVFVGPNASFSNDPRPRSGVHLESFPRTVVREGASLGAAATVLPGITIGRSAIVGAGSVVTRDVIDFALVYGNPARARGWVCRCGRTLRFEGERSLCACGGAFRREGTGAGAGRILEEPA